MKIYLGIFLFTLTLFQYVESEATKQDYIKMRKLVGSLKGSRNQVKKALASYKKKLTQIRGDVDKRFKELNTTVKSVNQYFAANQAKFHKDECEVRLTRFKRDRVRNYNKELDVIFKAIRNEVTDGWNTARKQHETYKNREVRAIITKQQSEHHRTRKHGPRVNQLRDFEEYVNKTVSMVTVSETMVNIADQLGLVSHQILLQRFNEAEKLRSDGRTGVKHMRTTKVGEKNYHSNGVSGDSVAGIYDKPSRTKLGISEFVAVMNGIEFRNDRLDYDLKKPANNDNFHVTNNIEFPDVPVEVTDATSIDGEIVEMREYLRAFHYEDSNIRDYVPFFKPIITYLEGAWLLKDDTLYENDENLYQSYTGLSGRIPYSPSLIRGFSNDGGPTITSWDYRFLAHEINTDRFTNKYLSPSFMLPKFDPASLRRHDREENYGHATRRFDIEGIDVNGYRRVSDRDIYYTLQDEIMEQIPGKNNYGGYMEADTFDVENGKIISAHPMYRGSDTKPALNVAHYHRPYAISEADAMGERYLARSFSDRVYFAYTDQESVHGAEFRDDKKQIEVENKISYAMPWEIVYLSPLTKWNPMSINTVENCDDVTGDGTMGNPYSAACPDLWYLTPQKFYTEAADYLCVDGMEGVYVHSLQGAVCMVSAGTKILQPPIHNIPGRVRQRYPIMPLHGEGSSAWKTLDAIISSIAEENPEDFKIPHARFHTGLSTHAHIPPHSHEISISREDYNMLIKDNSYTKTVKCTTKAKPGSHQHIVTLKRIGTEEIGIVSCNSGPPNNVVNNVKVYCFDYHPETVIKISEN